MKMKTPNSKLSIKSYQVNSMIINMMMPYPAIFAYALSEHHNR